MDTHQHRRLQALSRTYQLLAGREPDHIVLNYLPGQVTYNLGEYPLPFSIAPTEYDAELLGRFAAAGGELIQFHEEWNDSQRLLGSDKFTSHDPAGLHEFPDLCHSLGLKVMPYISSGFLDIKAPDFREKFHDAIQGRMIEVYFDYAHCFAGTVAGPAPGG